MNRTVRTAGGKLETYGMRGLRLLVCSILALVMCAFAAPHAAFAAPVRGQVEEASAAIYQALAEHREGPIDISAFNLKDQYVTEAWDSALKAHPELFDVRNCCFDEVDDPATGMAMSITPEYFLTDRYSVEQILQMRQKAYEGFADAMASIPADGTDLEKVKAAYDWVCLHVKYDHAAVDALDPKFRSQYGWIAPGTDHFFSYAAYGAFVEGTCVCTGYADTLCALMDQCGIDCDMVRSSTHAWNKVYVDGAWYNLDACWDASHSYTVTDEGSGMSASYVRYNYFMKSDAAVLATEAKGKGEGARLSHEGGDYFIPASDTRYDDWTTDDWEAFSA